MTDMSVQALQTLQEQQGKMLLALIPLLPLIQTIPLHVETAQNRVIDALHDTERFLNRHEQRSSCQKEQLPDPRSRHQSAEVPPNGSLCFMHGAQPRKRRRLDQQSDNAVPNSTTIGALCPPSPPGHFQTHALRPVDAPEDDIRVYTEYANPAGPGDSARHETSSDYFSSASLLRHSENPP